MAFTDNPAFSPANLLTLSGNILANPNFGAGIGTGFQQLGANVTAQQKEQAERQRQLQETAQMGNYLRAQAPGTDLSTFTPKMVEMAASTALQKQLNPAAPEFKVLPDGTYGTWDGSKFNTLGRATKPEEQPAIAKEFNWAKENGFKGTPQDYQVWKASLTKQKGMVIESDGNGGFRVVQGDVDTSKMPKLTEAEGKNAGFLKRALTAEKEISALEGEGTSLWNKAADAVPVLGNFAKSDGAQKFDQAQRNFINAVLRRESGAVISPEEFANARQQYFPQPGDGADVIAQKRKNREDAIAGFEIGSGPAAERVQEMDANEQQQADPLGIR